MKRKTVYVAWNANATNGALGIWGLFSSEKRLMKVLKKWHLKSDDTGINGFEVDYRLKTAPPKYLSDNNG